MFSAALSSGQAGGSGTRVRLLGGLSLRVVCQPALSRMSSACADGATARPIASRCACMASVSACDGAEYIGVLVALILGLAWARSLPGPLIDETVLLADPHFVLEPDFDRRPRGERAYDLRDLRWKVFLKAAIASGFWTGCWGRAL